MTDQCKLCKYRGDLNACQSTDCFKHEDWYPIALNTKIAALEQELNTLRVMVNARRLIKAKAMTTNAMLYAQLFGAGDDAARERCTQLGLEPDDNKTSYSEAIKRQVKG